MDSQSIELNLTNKTYDSYLEQLNTFYKLKSKYTKKNDAIKRKIINMENTSIEVKKQLYAKEKFKCVNCGKDGGTIFTDNSEFCKAICGNNTSPCDLNIEIKKKRTRKLDNELIEINNAIKEAKKNIVLTKLNYLFKYLEEDKAVEDFESAKEKLANYQAKYNEMFLLYESITNNKDNAELINNLLIEKHDLVNTLKEYIGLYKTSGELRYLKDAHELYLSKLKTTVKNIRESLYKYNDVELQIENKEVENILYQSKYTQDSFEFFDNLN